MRHNAVLMQECPICGRPLAIRVDHIGRRVACQHCGGLFLAVDAAREVAEYVPPSRNLLKRADQLLEIAARRLQRYYQMAEAK